MLECKIRATQDVNQHPEQSSLPWEVQAQLFLDGLEWHEARTNSLQQYAVESFQACIEASPPPINFPFSASTSLPAAAGGVAGQPAASPTSLSGPSSSPAISPSFIGRPALPNVMISPTSSYEALSPVSTTLFSRTSSSLNPLLAALANSDFVGFLLLT